MNEEKILKTLNVHNESFKIMDKSIDRLLEIVKSLDLRLKKLEVMKGKSDGS